MKSNNIGYYLPNTWFCLRQARGHLYTALWLCMEWYVIMTRRFMYQRYRYRRADHDDW